jgi:hypothetical protein
VRRAGDGLQVEQRRLAAYRMLALDQVTVEVAPPPAAPLRPLPLLFALWPRSNTRTGPDCVLTPRTACAAS